MLETSRYSNVSFPGGTLVNQKDPSCRIGPLLCELSDLPLTVCPTLEQWHTGRREAFYTHSLSRIRKHHKIKKKNYYLLYVLLKMWVKELQPGINKPEAVIYIYSTGEGRLVEVSQDRRIEFLQQMVVKLQGGTIFSLFTFSVMVVKNSFAHLKVWQVNEEEALSEWWETVIVLRRNLLKVQQWAHVFIHTGFYC